MKLSFLVSADAKMIGLIGVLDMFESVNDYYRRSGQPSFFDLELITLNDRELDLPYNLKLKPHRCIDEVRYTDVLIAPAIQGNMPKILEDCKPFIPLIQHQYKSGAEIMSLCTGAFLVALSGILDGKPCTTHWMAMDAFRTMFPKVNVIEDGIITDKDRIYTSGGAFSSFNLVIYFIEKYCGKEIALFIAKTYAVDYGRVSQSHFAIFSAQKTHNDTQIKAAQEFMEANYAKGITIDQVANKVAINKRTFIRRFKKATNNTPIEYIQRIKIEAAKKALETSSKSVNNIMYDVGYNDVKTFRNLFKDITGITPTQYRNHYTAVAIN